MKILFLTKYDRLAATTRYRFLQFMPFLREKGIECDYSPFLDDRYLRARLSTGKKRLNSGIGGFLKRLYLLPKLLKYDLIVVHYEMFPYFPAVFESLCRIFRIRYLCEFDDAMFHAYDHHPNPIIRFFLKNKIKRVIRYSSGVIAGNEYLAEYARQANANVIIVPTVVDTQRYHNGQVPEQDAVFTIGWIGSPSTATYLNLIADVLERFCSKYNARLVLIGAGDLTVTGVPVRPIPWSEATEIDEIRKFNVGIMPLPDSPWAKGKCSFKLIQYMACGVPVIASPIGMNKVLVNHGVEGFLANSMEEWTRAFEFMITHPEKRKAMGKSGRKKVEENYSLEIHAPRLLGIYQTLAPKIDG